jgi:hypothetical protein
VIFDADDGVSYPAVVMESMIEPFGEAGRSVVWKGTDNSGAQVAPGIYQVRMRIDAVNRGNDPVEQRSSIQLI